MSTRHSRKRTALARNMGSLLLAEEYTRIERIALLNRIGFTIRDKADKVQVQRKLTVALKALTAQYVFDQERQNKANKRKRIRQKQKKNQSK